MYNMTRWAAHLPRLAGAATLACALLAGAPIAGSAHAAPAAPLTAAWSLPALPLAFEPNVGQAEPDSSFLARTSGYSLLIGPTTMQIIIATGHGTVRLSFLGANPQARVEGLDRLPGMVNYFLGRDPRRWHTAIPTYARLRVRDLYPGIDLLYYQGRRGLEYDLLAHPGSDPRRIRLAAPGALLRGGELTWHTAAGTLALAAPTSYQPGAQARVAGNYQRDGDGTVSFRLARYDPRRPLVIDPYVKAFGNSGFGSYGGIGKAIAMDSAGNTYVTGTATGPFPTTSGAALTKLPGEDEEQSYIVVLKLNPAGKVLFTTLLGGADGPGSTQVGSGGAIGAGSTGIALEGAGNVYIVGSTYGTYFPLVHPIESFPPPDQSSNPLLHAFVAKLNPTGSKVLFSTYLGGNLRAGGTAIAVDTAGTVYFAGFTDANEDPNTRQFPVTAGHRRCSPGIDGFVAKINPTGSKLLNASCIGAPGSTYTTGIARDRAGNVYATGYTDAYPPTVPLRAVSQEPGVNNAFVVSYDSTEHKVRYAAFLGGMGDNEATGIAVDGTGSAYITGHTTAEDFPTTKGAFANRQHDPTAGLTAAFVAALNPAGTGLRYSTYLSGNTDDAGAGITVNKQGDAFVTGSIAETLNQGLADNQITFPTTHGADHQFHPGGDGFLTELNPTGKTLLSSTMLYGVSANAVALGPKGHPTLTGSYTRQDPQDSSAKDILLIVYAL